jgi:membrane complex biogenesis BtpA family protein
LKSSSRNRTAKTISDHLREDIMTSWVVELFGTTKPVIGMAHIPALPGTPRYKSERGVGHLVQHVSHDVDHLVEGGVDGILFCNEDDRPYVFEAGIEQLAAMTRVVTEARPTSVAFGVDFLWDPMAAVAIGHATGASFVREVLTGFYESDMGLWSPNAGRVARFCRNIGAENLRIFYNVEPEFSSSLGDRTVADRARSAIVSCLADVILISGPMAGAEPDLSIFEEVKEAVGDVPVFLNTGARHDNVTEYLKVADGVIVGSSLKIEGQTWNPVEPERVVNFVKKVKRARTV